MGTYMHKIISFTFWCYGKRPSLVRIRARSTFQCYGKRPRLVRVRARSTMWKM